MKLSEPTSDALDEELPASPIASVSRALPGGYRLGEFEVESVIGGGSATIIYAATDQALGVPVAIAEYMPARLAQRGVEAQVTPTSSSEADRVAKGLKAFINETRTLAHCDHPSLLRILRLWEGNATAYRVMPRYPSRRLLDVRRSMNEPPDEKALRALLDALLGALGSFHDQGGCHGKVTPSNILLLADNRPLLLGPGAAGRAIASDRIDALTSADPSFAPIEQIVEADIQLHPSVDLYALAGVARYWVSGQLPAPALSAPGTARRETLANTVQRLCLTWPRLHYSAALLDALDSALSIYPAQRPRSVAEMRARLGTALPTTAGLVGTVWTPDPVLNDATASSPVPQPSTPARGSQDLDGMTALAPDTETSGVARIDIDPSDRTALVRQAPYARLIALWSGAVLGLLALLVVGMYALRQEHQVGRVLDVLGISRGTGAGDSASASTYAVGPAPPGAAQIAADAGTANLIATEPTAADAGSAKSMPSEPATGDAGTSKSSELAPGESPASATASASPASGNRATLNDADTPAPAAGAPSRAPSPPPTRVARQSAARVPASPRAVCGARTDFALYRCMQLECSQRQWVTHPQCERLRLNDTVD